jgi:ABC-type multidrug transport system fused ATPase/permease subunit
LSAKDGETLAIVGPSGQGKSTIIQLVEEFYRPSDGVVKYNGDDLVDLNVRWYRNEIGLVSQEPTLFDTTISENIKFGMPEATQTEIEEAAKSANAHNFITEFPDGYNTMVGTSSASQISGGQKQRIA